MVSRYIGVALRHFTQHGKDIRIDTMIRNTIVALVLLLSAASVNAALIPINVELTHIQGPWGYQGSGVGTYNSDTTEMLFTISGSGFTAYGGDYQVEIESEILGLLVREQALSCTPTDIFLCTNLVDLYDWTDRQVASNTVNEFGSGTVSGVISNEFYNAQTTYNISPVPLPAAAWLFGSALLGLIGYSRRKVAKAHA
jgi:hypothetical protein